MILGDIRIQLMLSVFVILAFSAFLMPDRYGSHKGAYTAFFIGAVGMAVLAVVPQIYRHLGPLPTGPDAAGNIWVHLANARDNPGLFAITALALYAVLGIAWALGYFVLYARRLGQSYVLERDSWMKSVGVTSLDNLSDATRADFTTKVLEKVKSQMLYEGDFPLNPFQQKRFFVANLMLWPATLLWYLVGDLTVDLARHVWFAFRGFIQQRWDLGMAEYLADDALARVAEKSAPHR